MNWLIEVYDWQIDENVLLLLTLPSAMRSHFHDANLLGSRDKLSSHRYQIVETRQIGNQNVHICTKQVYW